MLSLFSRSTFVASSRSFSTSPLACKSVADSVKDAADKANRMAGDALKSTVEAAENLKNRVVDSDMSKQTKDMASDAVASGKKMASGAQDGLEQATSAGKHQVHKAEADIDNAAQKASH